MKVRIISSLIALMIAFFAVWQFNGVILNILGMIVFIIAISEIYNAFKEGNTKFFIPILIFFGAVVIARPYIMISPMISTSIFIFLVAVTTVLNFTHIQFKSMMSGLLFALFVLFGLYSVLRLKIVMPFEKFGWDGAFLFVISGAIAWGGDVMAYFSGYFFGKHKLAPNLSPKKTIEGAIGGIIGSVFFALIITWGYSYAKPIIEGTEIVYTFTLNKALVLGAIAAVGSVIGIIGDLFASAIKRQCGIKDYGSIMPGHGGVLDRFDSILLVAPFVSIMGDLLASSGGIL